MKRLLLSVLFFYGCFSGFSQRTCAFEQKLTDAFQDDPSAQERFIQRRQMLDSLAFQAQISAFATSAQPAEVKTVKVVFHVLYKNATQNISDAQINSQLAVLNSDFRRLNTDYNTVVPLHFKGFSADLELQFVKATMDPNGNATTGITRKSVASGFDFYNNYYTAQGQPAWNPDHYLNIWIGDFGPTSNVLGFALDPLQYAGEPEDGLVISYRYFGTMGTAEAPFNKGRTATHELGHYFGLLHPWGVNFACGTPGNNDGADDVPATNSPYTGCPNYPTNLHSCVNTTHGSMFMNFMDYVNDACMAMFSANQKTITQNIITGVRASLFLDSPDFRLDGTIAVFPNPASGKVTVKSPTVLERAEVYDVSGRMIEEIGFSGSEENTFDVSHWPAGTYFIRLYQNGSHLKTTKLIRQ